LRPAITLEILGAQFSNLFSVEGDLRTSVGAWIDANWAPHTTLGEWWSRLFGAGYAFPGWPRGMGGFAATPVEQQIVTGALAAAGVIGPPQGVGVTMAAPTLLRHASAEQQRRLVPPIGRGEVRWCQLFSEPCAGSDLASLSTRAEIDGDELVVNGHKTWSSGADMSDWGMLLCRTDVDRPKREGITFVVIDMAQPGVEVRTLRQINGDSTFCEVFFTDARVPARDVIGGLDEGWKVARTTLGAERASAAAGRARGMIAADSGRAGDNLDVPVGELVDRSATGDARSGGRPELLLDWRSMRAIAEERQLCGDPVMRDRLMRYFINSEVHRLNARRAVTGGVSSSAPDGSMMKLSLAMLARQSRDVSLALLGAEAMLSGGAAGGLGRVQRAALSSFVPAIGGGTDEIQRTIIGERRLGLPSEPGDDQHVPFRELRR
jgi:alkylation response protein AidB-like acyl-CoA dehydrogenase